MLQRLPIALAQVKPGNTFENEIRQIMYSLCLEKEEKKQEKKKLKQEKKTS